jgi:AraC family transcriptional regulator, regulatory protein of adaptative response / DNA-3-methyladenine glycosylase II
VDLDANTCFVAMASRDRRFEGRFFVAVRTTKIYCRPGCPARVPLRKNVSFYSCAAAAEEAGYRPCARCRPDASPDTSVWLGTSATVRRALRLIADEGLGDDGVDALADRLGIGARHLRRLFSQHVGASPLAVAHTRRLHFARKLLDETPLPVSDVAFASGFSSVRRFNDAVRHTFRRSPTELRRVRASRPGHDETRALMLRIPFSPPYDFDQVLAFLGARAIPGVELVDAFSYGRTFRTSAGPATLRVTRGGADEPSAFRGLVLSLWGADSRELFSITERVRRLFDVAVDPQAIRAHLGSDPLLRRLVRARPGLRVPGAWDGFEVGVRAILGQQVSVAGATTLAGRLVDRFGERIQSDALPTEHRETLTHLFPTPGVLAEARVEACGLPGARAKAIRSFARAVASGELVLGGHAHLDDAVAALVELPGIGLWTAHYIAMRALREPDALPAADLILRRAIVPGQSLTAKQVEQRAETWRPWRAYAVMHLWTGASAPSG